jgi:prepilin-type N-terminal cleavage/methylation domain-containing protein
MRKIEAFTLIELLVVIAIIGILSALIIVGMSSTTQKATIAKAQVFSNSLRNSLMSNLVSEWKFESGTHTDGQGADTSDVKDTWGTNDASAVSGATIKEGISCVSNKCLSFDGNDYVDFTENIQPTSVTVSFWAYATTLATQQSFVEKCEGFGVRIYNNKIRGVLRIGTAWSHQVSSAQDMPLNIWTHIVMSYDSVSGKNTIYINSKKDGEITIGGDLTYTTYSLNIGAAADGALPFTGKLDDVRIFNAAMPTSQVQQKYFAGLNKLFAKNQINQTYYQQRLVELSNNYAKE